MKQASMHAKFRSINDEPLYIIERDQPVILSLQSMNIIAHNRLHAHRANYPNYDRIHVILHRLLYATELAYMLTSCVDGIQPAIISRFSRKTTPIPSGIAALRSDVRRFSRPTLRNDIQRNLHDRIGSALIMI
jgi:hypothetical protein